MNELTDVLTEETLDPADWESMRALGHRILDDALDYVETLRDRPAWRHAPPLVKAHFGGPPPLNPEPPEEVYQEYLQYILPYQMGNSHPRFWGWVAGTGTVMGIFAELLAAATNAISGVFAYVSNNYVEMQVLDWCKTLLGYPPTASGLLTSGCSASNLIGLAVARNARAGFDLRSKGMQGAQANDRLLFGRDSLFDPESHRIAWLWHRCVAPGSCEQLNADRSRSSESDNQKGPYERLSPSLCCRSRRNNQHWSH